MVNIPHSKRMPDGTLVPCTLMEWAEWVEAPGKIGRAHV